MPRSLRSRFWLESVVGATAIILFLLTFAWHDWIEIVFRVDPDHGSGVAEWLIVAVAGCVAWSCSALARLEWLRARRIVGSGTAALLSEPSS
jgi:hypothetical protein